MLMTVYKWANMKRSEYIQNYNLQVKKHLIFNEKPVKNVQQGFG